MDVFSASKKTTLFYCFCLEGFKDKAFEALKIKEFTFVNDCFQNENNAVFGVFLQRLFIKKLKKKLTQKEPRISEDECKVLI